MNALQIKVLVATLCATAAAAAFPPWQHTRNGAEGMNSRSDAGYHFVADPPRPAYDSPALGVSIDFGRLLLEFAAIGCLGVSAVTLSSRFRPAAHVRQTAPALFDLAVAACIAVAVVLLLAMLTNVALSR